MPIPKGILISLGVTVGAQLFAALLTPRQKQPELDLSVQKSAFGSFIPIVWGSFRLAGNVVWAPRLQERGRGGKRRKKTRSFAGSAFIVLCEGTIAGFKTLWLNRKARGVTLGALESGNFEFFFGEANQSRPSLIEATEGTANSFGWGYRAGILVDSLPLTDYGERLPQIEAEVVTAAVAGNAVAVSLADIVSSLAQRVDVSPGSIDVSELESIPVVGAAIRQQSTAQAFLAEIRQVYFFDAIQSGWKIKFIRQLRPSGALRIPSQHMGTIEYSGNGANPYDLRQTDPLSLPRSIALTFVDRERNYESNTATARRNQGGENDLAITVPVVLTPSQAQQVAQRLLHLAWIQRRSIKTTLPALRYGSLEAGDVVELLVTGQWTRWQVDRLTWGSNLILEVEAKSYDGTDAVFGAPGIGPSVGIPITDSSPGIITLQVLDVPLIRDSEADFAVPLIVSGTNWQGASIYLSRDAGASYQFHQSVLGRSVFGTCQTALANYTGDFDTLDATSVVRVQITSAVSDLATITETRMRNGENVALVGNEIIRFQTATLVSEGVYDLSGLLRGRRGTELFRAGHASGERFTLLIDEDLELEYARLDYSDLGNTLLFKAVAGDQELEDVITTSLTYQGAALRCYAPTLLGATKTLEGAITVQWTRRDRRGGDRTDYAALPMSEVKESYEVDIRNAGDTATVRTLTSHTAMVVYSTADQVADFGAVQSSLRVRVYQISALTGRGSAATATLTPTTTPAAPVITDISPRSTAVGSTVQVYGDGFTGTTAATINGVTQTYSVLSDGEISITIAAGTITGRVVVVAPGGTGTSAIDLFIV